MASQFALSLVGCVGSGPLQTRLFPEVRRPAPGVVLFICDGLYLDLVERGCREGWLPNIQKRFVAGGTRVENAISVFPAITYPAVTTLLTGVSPERHGITGNRYFDPHWRRFRNYVNVEHYRDVNADFDVPTIYERMRPLVSCSIQAAPMRGVSDNIANWAQSGVRWFFGAYTSVDGLTAQTVELVACHANDRGAWPALLTCYFPGVDTIGHHYGPSSAEYRAAVVNVDVQLGRVCDWLEAQGLLETTYLVLISDHGMVDVRPDGYINLMKLVRKDWRRNATDTMDQDDPYNPRRRFFDRFDTAVAYQDGRKAFLYFAGPSGWDEAPNPATVAQILAAPPAEKQLWNLPGIDLVEYLAAENEAIIRSPRGEARVVERRTPNGPEYHYLPGPDDPLGYLDDPKLGKFVAAGFHDSRAWLHATAAHEFPDLVPHIVPLLRNPRAGQVIVSTAPGYSFTHEPGGHGGARRVEMRVPFMFAGPGIKPGGTLECACSVDLVPTLLVLLGRDPPNDGSLEGIPLFADIHARPATMRMPR